VISEPTTLNINYYKKLLNKIVKKYIIYFIFMVIYYDVIKYIIKNKI